MLEEQDRTYQLRLVAEPERFAGVRRIVQAHLRYWGLAPLVDPVLLGLTELLANVHQHTAHTAGGAECLLDLTVREGCLTVSLHDADPLLPQAREAGSWDLCGRGLAIIGALSKEWGTTPEPDAGLGGKVVWFSLATEQVAETVRLVKPARPTEAARTERTPVAVGKVPVGKVPVGAVDPGLPAAPLRLAPLRLSTLRPPLSGGQKDRAAAPARLTPMRR